MKTVITHCNICLAQCGIEVTVDEAANRVLDILPDRQNPYTWRDFCRKGKTGGEVVAHPHRITTPLRRVGDRWVPATYSEATADIAARLNRIIERHGADAVASYHGNPMGFCFSGSTFYTGLLDAIGTGNRYWVGSIDTNAFHIVAEEMFGSELMLLVSDIDPCKCFLLVGMDPAVSKFAWTETSADGWNRVLAAQRNGADVIVVDPRRSKTAEAADLHVPIVPGQDWAFLLGVLKVVLEENLDRPSTAVPLSGVESLRRLVGETDLDSLSALCGVEPAVMADVARRFAGAPTAMCQTHTGPAHNQTGAVAEWLGWALNAVTGRLDVPGGRRLEKGYLDVQAIASVITPSAKHYSRVRKLPTVAGFHSLAELADEITTPGPGKTRALLVAMGNPVVSGPDGAALEAAIEELELYVAVDLVQRESHRRAHWLIPGTHWLERDELNPLMGILSDQPYAHRAQQAVKPPPGVKEEWEFFVDLALAMQRPLFGKPGVNGFVKASRALARRTGRPGLAMNPAWVENLLVAVGRRVKMKDIKAHPHGLIYDKKRYGDMAKALRTKDKTVHCAPRVFVDECRRLLAETPDPRSAEFPLLMINQRSIESMNSWLNELPGVHQRRRSNDVVVNAEDAADLGIADGQQVRISSAVGAIEAAASVTGNIRRGVVSMAHGWGSRIFDTEGNTAVPGYGVNRNLLVNRADIDPLSQTPAFNSVPVRLDPLGP